MTNTPAGTVKLSKPITGPKGPIHQLQFREPTFAELRRNGEPHTRAYGSDGMVVSRVNYDVISAYARDLVEGTDPLLLDQCSARDGIAMAEMIIGFFSPPAEKPALSVAPTVSSSPSTGTPALSIE